MTAPGPGAAPSAAQALIDDRAQALRKARLARTSVRVSGLFVATGLLALVCIASLALGSKSIAPREVLDALLHGGDTTNDAIVTDLRVPRTLIGLEVGAALGLAGALMQGLTRNPLADPGILGINAGAALAMVVAIAVANVTSVSTYIWFAFVGAALAGLVVYGLGTVGREGATPVRIALAGAAVSAMLISLTTSVLVLDQQTFDQFRYWAVGSLAGRPNGTAAQVAPFLLAGAILGLAAARVLDALGLGDDVARTLGVHVGRGRALVMASIVLLSGAATAAAGPIAFVGLAIPHVVRALTGPDHRWLLPYSLLVGPIFLLSADVVGRLVLSPSELQVGIVTALVGGPVFVAIVRRRRIMAL